MYLSIDRSIYLYLYTNHEYIYIYIYQVALIPFFHRGDVPAGVRLSGD